MTDIEVSEGQDNRQQNGNRAVIAPTVAPTVLSQEPVLPSAQREVAMADQASRTETIDSQKLAALHARVISALGHAKTGEVVLGQNETKFSASIGEDGTLRLKDKESQEIVTITKDGEVSGTDSTVVSIVRSLARQGAVPKTDLAVSEKEQQAEQLKAQIDDLAKQGLLTSDIADLYKTKIDNFGQSGRTGYDDLDAGISPEQARQLVALVQEFKTAGYSDEQVRALVALGTGKGGVQGLANLAEAIRDKDPHNVFNDLSSSAGGWRDSIVYLRNAVNDKGVALFRNALDSIFGQEEIEQWRRDLDSRNQAYLARQREDMQYNNYDRSVGKQVSVQDYLANPFDSGELGKKAAQGIANQYLKPGGYCLYNVQTALNNAGFNMGNMGAYAYKSLQRFENDPRFVEVTGSREELAQLVKEGKLPQGTVVYSKRFGDTRGHGTEPYGDVGIVSDQGRVIGYDRGGFDSNGQSKLVYGNNTEEIRLFIPVA